MSTRCFKYTLTIVFLLVCGSSLLPQPGESGIWWQVELRAAVTGTYSYRSGLLGYEGEYSFTAQVLGTLQEDEDDFIFVQAYEKVSDLAWKETAFDGAKNKTTNLAGKIKPTATLNYVFKGEEGVSFAFGIEPVKVNYPPLLPGLLSRILQMPKSAEDESVNPDHDYEKGITVGSNRLELPVKDMYSEGVTDRVFKWKWESKQDSPSWQEAHDVEVTLKILRRMK